MSRGFKEAASLSVAKGNEHGTRKKFDRTLKESPNRFSTYKGYNERKACDSKRKNLICFGRK